MATWTHHFRRMGPAWVISAVACGPATLASVSIAGASYGFSLLWVVILSATFGATSQYLAAKIGVLSGKGIIALTEERLGPVWSWLLTIDALVATYIAAIVLMNALVGITGLVTGLKGPWWGVMYALLITAIIVRGGYSRFELACKIMVGFVVLCFVLTAFQADIDLSDVLQGLVPNTPGGMTSALTMAAIMGGAVHITIIGMHTYTVNERRWKAEDLPLARFDTIVSMGVAFGIYSLAIYTVAAAVLHPNNIQIKGATDAALGLGPLLGKTAMSIFLIGLWGATFSTISPTFLAGAYFIFDKLGWQRSKMKGRFEVVILSGALLSAIGPFIKGSFFLLLPVMLALGLCGTPLILAIILYFLSSEHHRAMYKNSDGLYIMAILTLMVTTILAIRFIIQKLGTIGWLL